MEKKEKILILGAGAIGALYGGKLQQAGCDVSVIAHSDGDIFGSRKCLSRCTSNAVSYAECFFSGNPL